MNLIRKTVAGGVAVLMLLLLGLGTTVVPVGVQAAPPATPATAGLSQYFPQTGHTVQGAFWQYWQSHGGLVQQGYPISEEFTETSAIDSTPYTVQYFERAVFEYHPRNAGTPYAVLLTPLGRLRYTARYGQAGPPGQTANQAPGAAHFFAETGYGVDGDFWQYWQAHGGMVQQGYPISNEFVEISALDGLAYTVQYFERAVFESHPTLAGTPFAVSLSQLGTYRYAQLYQAGTSPPQSAGPTPGPAAGGTPAPAPATAGRLYTVPGAPWFGGIQVDLWGAPAVPVGFTDPVQGPQDLLTAILTALAHQSGQSVDSIVQAQSATVRYPVVLVLPGDVQPEWSLILPSDPVRVNLRLPMRVELVDSIATDRAIHLGATDIADTIYVTAAGQLVYATMRRPVTEAPLLATQISERLARTMELFAELNAYDAFPHGPFVRSDWGQLRFVEFIEQALRSNKSMTLNRNAFYTLNKGGQITYQVFAPLP